MHAGRAEAHVRAAAHGGGAARQRPERRFEQPGQRRRIDVAGDRDLQAAAHPMVAREVLQIGRRDGGEAGRVAVGRMARKDGR